MSNIASLSNIRPLVRLRQWIAWWGAALQRLVQRVSSTVGGGAIFLLRIVYIAQLHSIGKKVGYCHSSGRLGPSNNAGVTIYLVFFTSSVYYFFAYPKTFRVCGKKQISKSNDWFQKWTSKILGKFERAPLKALHVWRRTFSGFIRHILRALIEFNIALTYAPAATREVRQR